MHRNLGNLGTWVFAALLLAPAAPAGAVEFGFFGLDVRGGVIFPDDWDTGYAVGASVNVARLVEGLYLYPAVAYSTADESDEQFGTAFELRITDLALGAEIRYFPAGGTEGFYFGGGPYLHSIEEDFVVRAFPGGVVTGTVDSDEVGATAVAGYKLGWLLAEARYGGVSGFEAFHLLVGFALDR